MLRLMGAFSQWITCKESSSVWIDSNIRLGNLATRKTAVISVCFDAGRWGQSIPRPWYLCNATHQIQLKRLSALRTNTQQKADQFEWQISCIQISHFVLCLALPWETTLNHSREPWNRNSAKIIVKNFEYNALTHLFKLRGNLSKASGFIHPFVLRDTDFHAESPEWACDWVVARCRREGQRREITLQLLPLSPPLIHRTGQGKGSERDNVIPADPYSHTFTEHWAVQIKIHTWEFV